MQDLGNSFKTSICVATRANTQVQDNIVSLSSNTDIQLTGTFTVASDGTVSSTTASAEESMRIRNWRCCF